MLQHFETFTIITVSEKLTSIMRSNIKIAQSVGVNYLWVKHTAESQSTTFGKLRKQTINGTEVSLIEFKTKLEEDFYNSAVLYNSAKIFSCNYKNDWFFWIDSDELIESKLLTDLKKSLRSLNNKTLYGVPRLWVKNFDNKWFSSGIARSDKSDYDIQYRIFNPLGIGPDYGVHKNFKVKKYKELKSSGVILHLIYELESLEHRCIKISNYETIQEGSGLSKLRYYLPEIFSKTKIGWVEVSASQNEALNRLFLSN